MKIKLLYVACLITNFTFAQTIATFSSENMSEYAIVDGAIDQSPTGANTTWNFTSLTSVGNSTDTYASPTTTQTTTFPGTTNVFTSGANNFFFKETAGEISLTGATTPDLELNYITDNGLIGTFPLSFGYTNSDPVAGTFDNGSISGTFAGNIVKTVNAHGTLGMNNVGAGAYSATITRLKVEQIITLSIPPFIPNAGNVTQTSYYYYDNNNGNLVFRSNTVHVVVPIANLDETTIVHESLLTNLLSVSNIAAIDNAFTVTPNPVNNRLHIHLTNATNLKSIMVSDINGRQVLPINISRQVDVSGLQAGMYLLTIETDSGIFTRKFIKN